MMSRPKFATHVTFETTPWRKKQDKSKYAPFIAWDSEGYTDDDGEHHMTLFGNSEGEYIQGKSLHWDQCFDLLLNAPKGNHVIFAGTYDVIMMIKQLPMPIRKRLHADQVAIYKGYRLHWIKRKWFHIICRRTGRRIKLYDVFSFFGCSFVKACRQYLGDDTTLREMERIKKVRNTFTYDDPRVLPYWQDELQYLVRLMEELRGLLSAVDIVPTGWHGPGAIATRILKNHKIKQHHGNIPSDVIDVAERAYYGGRFEQFGIGRIRDVNEYDIRSAYPCFIAQLPSWEHVTWTYYSGDNVIPPSFTPFGIYCVSWDLRPSVSPVQSIGPLPWRDTKGNIYYPMSGHRSWYWGIELENLMDLQHGQLHEAWIPTFPNSHEAWIPTSPNSGGVEFPFQWIQRMYDDRAKMKADGNPAQMALKLGMNSIYGKLAQSVGSVQTLDGEWKKPPFHNVLWAGWITAATRRELFKRTYRHGVGRIIAMETDAIYAIHELPIEISDDLGGWDHQHYDEIIYVQSGVYFARKGDKWKVRSRGIEIDYNMDVEQWANVLSTLPEGNAELVNSRPCFITDLRSNHYGKWVTRTRTTPLGTPSLSKRMHIKSGCVSCTMQLGSFNECMHNMIVPEPINDLALMQPSTPYKFPWRTDVAYVPEFKLEGVQVVDLDSDMLDWREQTQEDWEINDWIPGKRE